MNDKEIFVGIHLIKRFGKEILMLVFDPKTQRWTVSLE